MGDLWTVVSWELKCGQVSQKKVTQMAGGQTDKTKQQEIRGEAPTVLLCIMFGCIVHYFGSTVHYVWLNCSLFWLYCALCLAALFIILALLCIMFGSAWMLIYGSGQVSWNTENSINSVSILACLLALFCVVSWWSITEKKSIGTEKADQRWSWVTWVAWILLGANRTQGLLDLLLFLNTLL